MPVSLNANNRTTMQTQMDFTAARKRGHDAGDACARKAGDPWVEEALVNVLWYSRYIAPNDFTMEQLRSALTLFRSAPDARAWGTVTRQAMARGIIVRTGGYRAAVSSNGSPKPLYRKA